MWIGLPIVIGASDEPPGRRERPGAEGAGAPGRSSIKRSSAGSSRRPAAQGQIAKFLEIETVDGRRRPAPNRRGRRQRAADPPERVPGRRAPRAAGEAHARQESLRSASCRASSKKACGCSSRPRSTRSASSARRFARSLDAPGGEHAPARRTTSWRRSATLFNQRTARACRARCCRRCITLGAASGAPAARRTSNFGALFLPGLLFMALLFTAQGMSNDIWTEKQQGTLAPHPERAAGRRGVPRRQARSPAWSSWPRPRSSRWCFSSWRSTCRSRARRSRSCGRHSPARAFPLLPDRAAASGDAARAAVSCSPRWSSSR